MTLALTAGLLIAGAVYLFLQREMFRVILGFILLSHGVNLILFAAGGTNRRGEPIGGDLDPGTTADPLPQAFVLTAIVIAFSITIVMLMLAVAGRNQDDTHDTIADDADDEPVQAADEPGQDAVPDEDAGQVSRR
ncbi:MAG TPA: cation:proton antiporter subunit C [Beutenbergiaceae bacterium]|nr:cation:proton antiporter subunit C [Beutenbergiaceae bacterium]